MKKQTSKSNTSFVIAASADKQPANNVLTDASDMI